MDFVRVHDRILVQRHPGGLVAPLSFRVSGVPTNRRNLIDSMESNSGPVKIHSSVPSIAAALQCGVCRDEGS
jgi:hypothetical protein